MISALNPKKWRLLPLAGLVAMIIALPFLALSTWLFVPTGDTWKHLVETILADYILNSLVLCIGCMICTFLIGTTTAWLCSACKFRGQSFYRWALILPLAYPSYIIAFVYTGILDYGGSVYVFLYENFGLQTPLNIRSMQGAILVISATLYPYIYLLAYSAWRNNSSCLLETGRLLQAKPWSIFTKIALPVARPALIAGTAIVALETLAEYGAVSYFGVNTLSLGIMQTWFGLNSLASAAQLSFILLTFMVALMLLEQKARKSARYTLHYVPHQEAIYHLRHWKAVLAHIACGLPIAVGFVIPTFFLVRWTLQQNTYETWDNYAQLWTNTVGLALIATITIVACSMLFAYVKRNHANTKINTLIQAISSGYAIPGVVIAAAVMSLSGLIQSNVGWLLSGSMLALILAYSVRFMTLGVKTIDSGLEKISPTLDDSAKILNASDTQVLTRIHLPLIRPALITATLLVFVDIVKELPMTLTLRPFNFNTFSVKAYELASDERIYEIGFPALNIMLIGLIPLFIFIHTQNLRR